MILERKFKKKRKHDETLGTGEDTIVKIYKTNSIANPRNPSTHSLN